MSLSTSHDDIYFMQQALKEAIKAYEEDEVPVGAVIVHEEKIIARAHNQMRRLCDPTAHAEMIAITQAANFLQQDRLLGSRIYVTIEPCPMCAGALVWARCERIIFGAFDEKAGACGTVLNIVDHPRFNHRMSVISGVLQDEAQSIMRQFFTNKRK